MDEPAHGHFQTDTHELVGLGAQRLRAGAAGSASLESGARLASSRVKRRSQGLDGGAAERGQVAPMLLMEGGELIEKLGLIDALQRRGGARAAFDRRNLSV